MREQDLSNDYLVLFRSDIWPSTCATYLDVTSLRGRLRATLSDNALRICVQCNRLYPDVLVVLSASMDNIKIDILHYSQLSCAVPSFAAM